MTFHSDEDRAEVDRAERMELIEWQRERYERYAGTMPEPTSRETEYWDKTARLMERLGYEYAEPNHCDHGAVDLIPETEYLPKQARCRICHGHLLYSLEGSVYLIERKPQSAPGINSVNFRGE